MQDFGHCIILHELHSAGFMNNCRWWKQGFIDASFFSRNYYCYYYFPSNAGLRLNRTLLSSCTRTVVSLRQTQIRIHLSLVTRRISALDESWLRRTSGVRLLKSKVRGLESKRVTRFWRRFKEKQGYRFFFDVTWRELEKHKKFCFCLMKKVVGIMLSEQNVFN